MLSPRHSRTASCHCRLSWEVQPRLTNTTRNATKASEQSRLMAFTLLGKWIRAYCGQLYPLFRADASRVSHVYVSFH